MKIAIYARVSTLEQTSENQVIRLKDYAERMDWEYDIFEETMTTRKTRPVKQHVLKLLRERQYDGVVVWKLDRWARSIRELILEMEEFHSKGIKFISFTENIDFDTPSGKLQYHILSAFAEFERNVIGERTREGLARAKAQGIKLGRPFGSKDKKVRRKSGYILKEAKKRKLSDENRSIFKPINDYID